VHTEGPWNIQWQFDKQHNSLWGTILHVPHPERGKQALEFESVTVHGKNKEANAKLINEAPSLLSTLIALVESFETILEIEDGEDADGFSYEALDQANTLIKKLMREDEVNK
jgi:hypothetical protein